MDTRDVGSWADRQIDEALVTIATGATVLYARRVGRRLLPKVAVGAVVLGVVGLVAATIATVTGIVAAGGVAAWYRNRKRAQSSAAMPPSYGGASARTPSMNATATKPDTQASPPASSGPTEKSST
jgi:hypothetical protein